MSSQLWWYVARAGGIVAWILLASSVVLGLFLSTRVRPLNAPPAWTTDLHRFLGGLATIFVGVHVGAIMLDSYTSFGPADVLVPFASAWHPLWVAWGIVGMYLLLAVELTSLARRRMPRKLWHAVHLASLPLFAFATVHFAGAGTDAGNPIAVFGMVLLSGVVAAFLFRRVGRRPAPPAPVGRRPARDRRPSPTAPVGRRPVRDRRPSPAAPVGRRPVRNRVGGRPGAGEVERLGQVARVAVSDPERTQFPAPLDHAQDRSVFERVSPDHRPTGRER